MYDMCVCFWSGVRYSIFLGGGDSSVVEYGKSGDSDVCGGLCGS